MGKLIVIDGLDGSGKTTQINRLGEYLQDKGVPFRQICFPDYDQPSSALVKLYLSGAFGKDAGSVNAFAASSFYAVDRYASFKSFWEEDYESGLPIIAARYTTSNAIHQMSKLPKNEWDNFLSWLTHYEYALLGLPRPDRVIFLDMPPEVSQKLMSGRYHGDESQKDIHERDVQYLKTCRESALFAAEKDGWDVVSCAENGEALPLEVITRRLIDLCAEILK